MSGSNLKKWFKARDLFGGGFVDRALVIAKECNHPDARWLCRTFNNYGSGCGGWNEAMIILGTCKDSYEKTTFTAAINVSGMFGTRELREKLIIAANNGYIFAQALVLRHVRYNYYNYPCDTIVESAVFALEPEALHYLKRYKEAASLGHVRSMLEYVKIVGPDAFDYYYYIRKISKGDSIYTIETDALLCGGTIHVLSRMPSSGPLIYQIGDLFVDRPNTRHLKRINALYRGWKAIVISSIHYWKWMAKTQFLIVKDIRTMIAKLLWKERSFWAR